MADEGPTRSSALPTVGQGFEAAYAGSPPWDIGRPQREVLRLLSEGDIVGEVLDVGCGTGENALAIASAGHPTWGVDAAPTAVRLAREKAQTRGVPVEFVVADAMHLERLGRNFDTILDCGLLHTFDDPDRARYVASLSRAVRRGGRYLFLVFSHEEPADWGGPRRVHPSEVRASFGKGWHVDFVRSGRFETKMPEIAGRALVGRITRVTE